MRASDRFAEPDRPKTLRERVRPIEILEKELADQLTAQGLSIGNVKRSRFASSSRLLEAFLWRDITYFVGEGYTDEESVNRSLQRLREKGLFIDTVKEMIEQLDSTDE